MGSRGVLAAPMGGGNGANGIEKRKEGYGDSEMHLQSSPDVLAVPTPIRTELQHGRRLGEEILHSVNNKMYAGDQALRPNDSEHTEWKCAGVQEEASAGVCGALPVATPVSEQRFLGIGDGKSLQELMLGFTNGAICIGTYQVDQHPGTMTQPVLEKQNMFDAHTDDNIPEESYKMSEGYLPESDTDQIELEDGISVSLYESSDTEPNCMGIEDVRKVPDDSNLNNIDWGIFYNRGELVHKEVMDANSTEDVTKECQPESAGKGKHIHTWNKRRRIPMGEKRESFRLPRGMGAVEKAMRAYCEKKADNIYDSKGIMFEPYLGLEFDSEAEAYEYYNLYSWEVGFGIRKGKLDSNKSGYQRTRELVCQRQGFDKRTKTKTKGCNCKAMIRLHRTDDDGWFVTTFVRDHNHVLSATNEEKKEWSSHGDIDRASRDLIKYLRDNNVSLSKVQCIMGSLHGSMDNIPFTRRSLRTICAQIAREQRDDDIKKTLELFREMRANDPGFQFSVDLDEKDQIKTLIWAPGRSRSNYGCFGDVVTFDTTYCTNLYKMPFGLFVGVNNHFQTTIFAGVLVRDETAETFQWVFKEFLTLMGGVSPQTILTDQCRAMEIALKIVMPGTTHLWCKWHVFRDARVELGPIFRDKCSFKDEFLRLISEMCTVDEFEHRWKALLVKYKLETHHYMVKAYDKREKWAKCYNRGKFCARMTSTQRSESANHMLKTVVPRNSSMNRFVSNLNKLLYQRYAEEERAEHDTKQDVRVNKRLWAVERHALQVYTSKVYEMFSDEMDKTHHYDVPTTIDGSLYIVRHTNAEYVQRYIRPEYKVIVHRHGGRYECECGLYEHFGLLCCHILRVFIHTGVSEIPPEHIMQRWTRRARDVSPNNIRTKCVGSTEEYCKLYQQSQIYGKALEVARKGNYDFETYDIVMKYLQKAERKVDELMQKRREESEVAITGLSRLNKETDAYISSSETEVLSGNRYGAAGSCAGMSDEEVLKIQAPPRPTLKQGRQKERRYVSFLDKVEKGCKNKNGTKKIGLAKDNQNGKANGGIIKASKKKVPQGISTRITPHCTICKQPGHNRTRCPHVEVDSDQSD